MLKNYLITAYRNFARRKVNSLVITAGMVVSLGFCLLMFLYVKGAIGWDTMHPEADRLHLLTMDVFLEDDVPEEFSLFDFSDKPVETRAAISYVHANNFRSEIPELSHSVLGYNLGNTRPQDVRINNEMFKETVSSAEPDLLELISYRLVAGNAIQTAKEPGSIIISDELARKYFPEGALQRTITIYDKEEKAEFIVGAVVDLPEKSSIRFDILTNISSNISIGKHLLELQSNARFEFYTRLPTEQPIEPLEQKIQQHYETAFADFYQSRRNFTDLREDSPVSRFRFVQIGDIHLDPLLYWSGKANVQHIMIVAIVSIVLLVLSGLNYLLVTMAGLSARISEISTRRVNGAGRWQVLSQFWVENSLTTALSLVLATCLLQLALPYLQSTTGVFISSEVGDLLGACGYLLVALVFISLIISLYPARIIFNARLTDSLKGRGTYRTNTRLVNMLVIAQFVLCFGFISGSLIMNRQLTFILDQDLGIDQEQVVYLPDGANQLKESIARQPQFSSVARGGGWLFGHGRAGFINDLGGQKINLMQLNAEPELLPLFGMSIDWLETDFGNAKVAVVNGATADLIGRDSLEFVQVGFKQRVVGIVEDARLAPFTDDDKYFFITPNSQGRSLWQTFVKIKPGQTREGIAQLKEVWTALYPNKTFEYHFLDDYIAEHYDSYQSTANLLNLLTVLGLVIACLGLFALSGIACQNRLKEIGIRKVLGATARHIMYLLNKQVVGQLVLAAAISIPLSAMLISRWLENFTIDVGLDWYYFALAFITGLSVSVIVISVQTLKAVTLNPVSLIKDES